MRATWGRRAVLAGAIAAAAGPAAQDPPPPAGAWRSGQSETYTNPALAGSGLYLDLDVARDGSFRGTWGQYLCTAYPGAYGIAIHSCSLNATARKPVSGRFGPGRQGVIDLGQLGRSAFTWTAPSADELAIELPKNWQGKDPVLYRARLTRDGRPRPGASSPPREEGAPPSAVALYREFTKDAAAAMARHGGRPMVLEGPRGNLIQLGDGGAAIHVPDGSQPRALVLLFRDYGDVSGIREGARFRFRCTVRSFDYQYVHLDDCTLAR